MTTVVTKLPRLASIMKGATRQPPQIWLYLWVVWFAHVAGATDSLPQHQGAQLSLSSCDGHASIQWDTSLPLVIEFHGKTLGTAGRLLTDLRSVDQIPTFLAQLWNYTASVYSEAVFSLLDERFNPIDDADAQYKGSVHRLERTAFGSIQGEHPNILWRLVKFAFDPFGIVSNAGAAAQGIAQDGLANILNEFGLLAAADRLGLNDDTRSYVNRQVENFIANAHKQAGFRVASPFDDHYVVMMSVAHKQAVVKVICRMNPIALRLPAMTLIGMALLFESTSLARSATVYYSAGALFGTMIALAIVATFIYRNRNNKLVIGGGVSAFFYGLYQNVVVGANEAESLAAWLERSLNLPEHSLSTGFVAFVVLVASVVVLYLYIQGPIENPRTLNVISGAFKLSGVILLYCSSYSQALGATLVVLNLLSMACGPCCTRAVFCCCGRIPGVGALLQLIAEVVRFLTCSLCCQRPYMEEETVLAEPLPEGLTEDDDYIRTGVPATREAIFQSGSRRSSFAGTGWHDRVQSRTPTAYSQQMRSIPRESNQDNWRESPRSGARIQFLPKPARRASGMHERSAPYEPRELQQLRRRMPSTDSKIRYGHYPDHPNHPEHEEEYERSYSLNAAPGDTMLPYQNEDERTEDPLQAMPRPTMDEGYFDARQPYSGRKRSRSRPTQTHEDNDDDNIEYDDASGDTNSQGSSQVQDDAESENDSQLGVPHYHHSARHGSMAKRQRG